MQNINHFINVCNVIEQTASCFKAARIYYLGEKADGYAAFCKAEADELWNLMKRIECYIFKREGKITQQAMLPAIKMEWSFNDVLPMLKDKQVAASDAIEKTITALHQSGGHADAYFISKIFEDHLKEVEEICQKVDHFSSDQKVVDFNEKLYRDYNNDY